AARAGRPGRALTRERPRRIPHGTDGAARWLSAVTSGGLPPSRGPAAAGSGRLTGPSARSAPPASRGVPPPPGRARIGPPSRLRRGRRLRALVAVGGVTLWRSRSVGSPPTLRR